MHFPPFDIRCCQGVHKATVARTVTQGDALEVGVWSPILGLKPKFVLSVPLTMLCQGSHCVGHPKALTLQITAGANEVGSDLLNEFFLSRQVAGLVPIPPQAGECWTLRVKSGQCAIYVEPDLSSVCGPPPVLPEQVIAATLEPTALPDGQLEPKFNSEAERRFWGAYRAAEPRALRGLVTQQKVLSYRLDFAIPLFRVGIEIDGHAYHSEPDAFHQDRVRQRALELEGWRLIRFSGREASYNPHTCVEEAARLVTLWYPGAAA